VVRSLEGDEFEVQVVTAHKGDMSHGNSVEDEGDGGGAEGKPLPEA
jgi:hypothetical protein